MARKHATEPRCLECGYRIDQLHGSKCPECGTSFDLNDPATFDDGTRRQHPLDPRRPPSLVNCAVILALTVAGLIDRSTPGTSCFMSLGYLLWFVLVVAALIRLAASSSRPRPVAPSRQKQIRRRWMVAPVCGALLFPTLLLPWPLWIRFQISRSSLASAVQQVRAGTLHTPAWIGLYYVHDAQEVGPTTAPSRSVKFTTGHDFLDQYGFLFAPTPDPTSRLERTPIAPSWYIFNDRF